MVYSEKTLIWLLIKQGLSQLNQAGINPIEFLIWTQVSCLVRLSPILT